MDLLMSIKPKYVDEIFAGNKRFEFRKRVFKPVNRIYIYETSPVRKIVGYVLYEQVIIDKPLQTWLKCWEKAGMSFKEFEAYYHDSTKSVAIEIKKVIKFDEPMSMKEFDGGKVPQSFRYVNV